MNCEGCGQNFEPNQHYRAGVQRFCSEKCRQKYFSKKLYEKIKIVKENAMPKEIRMKFEQLAAKQQDASNFLKLKSACEVCGSMKNLVIHHIKYSPFESVTLCRSCHSYLHFKFLKWKKVHP